MKKGKNNVDLGDYLSKSGKGITNESESLFKEGKFKYIAAAFRNSKQFSIPNEK